MAIDVCHGVTNGIPHPPDELNVRKIFFPAMKTRGFEGAWQSPMTASMRISNGSPAFGVGTMICALAIEAMNGMSNQAFIALITVRLSLLSNPRAVALPPHAVPAAPPTSARHRG